ncbi:MAG: hypothetical protein K2X09_01505, partial [Rickettsiales bacterium]|nr:hypothetical protein [Rickettsiales bacterium]
AYANAASELGINPAILKKAIRQAGVAASEADGPQDNDPIAELANRIGKKREDVEKALTHNGFGVEHHNKWKSYAGGGDALASGYNGIGFTPDPAKLHKGVDEKALNWEPPVMGIHPDFADRHGNRLSNEAVEKLSSMAAELNTAGLVGRNQGRVIDSEPQGRRVAQAAGLESAQVAQI